MAQMISPQTITIFFPGFGPHNSRVTEHVNEQMLGSPATWPVRHVTVTPPTNETENETTARSRPRRSIRNRNIAAAPRLTAERASGLITGDTVSFNFILKIKLERT